MALCRRAFFWVLAGAFLLGPALSFALDIGGIEYISVAQFARISGMKYKTVERAKQMVVFDKYQTSSFKTHSRVARVNGYFINLGHPVAADKFGMLYLSKRDAYRNLFPVLFPYSLKNARRPFHIVIDAGHGGKDNGAVNKRYGVKEKTVNLDIALRLGAILKARGFKVSYTRVKDVFIELEHRPVVANKLRADLFISVHSNSAANNSVGGIETYALTPVLLPSSSSDKLRKSDTVAYPGNGVDGWSQLLSHSIQRALVDYAKASDRGARRARFAVLRTANMPACLVEVGYLSNSAECLKLAKADYRQKIAEAIAGGIAAYSSTARKTAEREAAKRKK